MYELQLDETGMYALLIQQHARHDQESENSHFLAEVDQAAIAPLSVFFCSVEALRRRLQETNAADVQ